MTHIEVLAEIADTSEGMRIRQEDIDILTKRLATLRNEQEADRIRLQDYLLPTLNAITQKL